MGILRTIKKNRFINSIVRKVLKKSSKASDTLHSFFIKRWMLAGVVDCQFKEITFKYYNECDDGLPSYFYYDVPYHEKADLSLFMELAKKSKTIVDIGANTGLYSIMASRVNGKANVFAIEPYRANAKRLRKNLALNAATNVTVCELALGARDGQIQMTVPKNDAVTDVSSMDGNFSKRKYPKVEWSNQMVKVQTLDHLAEEKGLRVDLIKCDVETFEMPVFAGADHVLMQDKPTIIFECFLDNERMLFFNDILNKYQYYMYLMMEEGVVYVREGFGNASNGLNFLLTPVKPTKTFISYKNTEELSKALLMQKVKSEQVLINEK
jgi:FkbM family methyltransferase